MCPGPTYERICTPLWRSKCAPRHVLLGLGKLHGEFPRATSRPGRPEHYHTWPDLVASGTKHYHGSQGRPPRDLGHQALSRRAPSSVRRETGPPDTERGGRAPPELRSGRRTKPARAGLASFEHKKTPVVILTTGVARLARLEKRHRKTTGKRHKQA